MTGAELPDRTDYRSAVYGSVVVTALLGALAHAHASAHSMAVSLLSTTVVFWLAHVWASLVSERAIQGRRLPWPHVGALAREEWPLVEAGFVPLVPLVLASIGVLSRDAGANIAVVLALAQLAAWGLLVGRRSHDTWPMAILSGAVTGLLGLIVVLLEIAIH